MLPLPLALLLHRGAELLVAQPRNASAEPAPQVRLQLVVGCNEAVDALPTDLDYDTGLLAGIAAGAWTRCPPALVCHCDMPQADRAVDEDVSRNVFVGSAVMLE